ncbi:hypothetical protein [Croceibacterium aestuarii]|uniref:hypothetical protein n=1 Tax=Croceibacterium aestuarii TaxID=3064139 RepID=UPI00272E3E8D|nr:hypothetical protein [Croceibacterium sp. D39]
MRRLKFRHLAIAATLCAALAACGDKQKQTTEGDASGEVLEGTISDDMLPLERLQSRPPLVEPTAASSGSPAAAASVAPAEEPAPAAAAVEPSGE